MNKESELKLIKQVKADPFSLKYIKNQTETICLEAVKKEWLALRHVKDQTEQICLAAVKDYGLSLLYVKNQTEAICLAAVKQDAGALDYVKNQTEAICLEAIRQDPLSIKLVKHQTDKICLEALKCNNKTYILKDIIPSLNINIKSIALITLNVLSKHNDKDKIILNKIINKFKEDKEILDFYTKHKLWKYVDFNKLNNELTHYAMIL